jgi:hypothetical protein
MFQTRIGTVRWRKVFEHWPQLLRLFALDTPIPGSYA